MRFWITKSVKLDLFGRRFVNQFRNPAPGAWGRGASDWERERGGTSAYRRRSSGTQHQAKTNETDQAPLRHHGPLLFILLSLG